MDQPLDIGNGLGIDPLSLRTVVLDETAFSAGPGGSTDPADRLLAALVTGRLDDAQELADELMAGGAGFRVRALAADVLSARGDHAAAIAAYRRLTAESLHTPREAIARQHLGKAFFTAGEWQAALVQFGAALRLREDSGAPADQLASSRLASARVAELLAEGCPGEMVCADGGFPSRDQPGCAARGQRRGGQRGGSTGP